MTKIAVKPIILNDVDFAIEEDNYEGHCSTIRFDPSTSIVRWKGMSPDSVFAAQTNPEWTLTVSYAQDWETADALSRYLHDNAGQVKTVKLKPKKVAAGSTTATVTAQIIIAPGPIGGDVDGVATGSVTMGVNGQPDIAAA